MRVAALLIVAGLPAYASAQQGDVRSVLLTAQQANWHIRATLAGDSVEGVVRSIFRDSVRIDSRKVFLPAIERVERRVRSRGVDTWRHLWPTIQDTSAATGGAPATGITGFLYAGTAMLVFPGVFLPLPPPLIGGAQAGSRGRKYEFTLNGRVLLYPAPFAIFAFDIGQNFLGNENSYAGIAAGIVRVTDGPVVLTGAARAGGSRSGTRYEIRVDLLIAGEAAVVLSVMLGPSITRPR
ncbi:MAG: hypothetical protein ACT443_05705 [Gemmatimonadota bacterium]